MAYGAVKLSTINIIGTNPHHILGNTNENGYLEIVAGMSDGNSDSETDPKIPLLALGGNRTITQSAVSYTNLMAEFFSDNRNGTVKVFGDTYISGNIKNKDRSFGVSEVATFADLKSALNAMITKYYS